MTASNIIIHSKAIKTLQKSVSKDLEQLKRILKPTPPQKGQDDERSD